MAALLEQRCCSLLAAQPGREVISRQFRMEQTDHAYVGILKAECLEPAGIEQTDQTGKEE